MDEIKDLLEKQHKAFEDFKAANDQAIKAKAEGKAVSELEAKVEKANDEIARLEKEIDDIVKKGRPGVPADESAKLAADHKSAWTKWARKGLEDGLAEIEQKAINVGTPADGGYALPIEQDREVARLLRDQSPMRQVARIVTVGTEDYRKLVNLAGTASGWVGEAAARTATNTPTFDELKPFMGEIYANPAVTQKALDDLYFDVANELVADIVQEFAEKEGAAFISGDGVNKPKGILNYATAATADGARAFKTLQHIATGTSGAFKAASTTVSPADDLIDMIYALKAGYRMNAQWMANAKVLAAIRKWKDQDGNYVWQPSTAAGQPSTLLGYSVIENADMPDTGAGAIPIMLGDFNRAYWIVDRIGVRMLRDPYTNKPYVHFYTTKRVGSMLVDSQAIKVLKQAAA